MNKTTTDKAAFLNAVTLYKKTKESFSAKKRYQGTREEIIEHLENAVFLLATLCVSNGENSTELTNKLLEENGLSELKLTS